MKLKSYMRGIGAGMIVAALIMSVSNPGKANASYEKKETLLEASVDSVSKNALESITDNDSGDKKTEEIQKADPVSSNNKKPSETVSEKDNTEVEKEIEKEVDKEETTTPDVSGNESKTEFIEEPEEINPPPINPLPEGEEGFVIEGDVIEIKVISGDSSVSVSRRLFEAGLVESAVEFDKFLCENGYDKFIRVGNFTIAEGSDFATIARTLTGR